MGKKNILPENGVEDYDLSLEIAKILRRLLVGKKYSEEYYYNKNNITMNLKVNSFVEPSCIINTVQKLLKNKKNFKILCNSNYVKNISTISIKY